MRKDPVINIENMIEGMNTMSMIQCPNGHLYDEAKNATCPFCDGGVSPTLPLYGAPKEAMDSDFPPTTFPGRGFVPPTPVAIGRDNMIPPTLPVDPQGGKTTYPAYQEEGRQRGDAVRGWLVCLEGAQKGADFKIHAEKNSIGRGRENDIAIDFDTAVSKGVNAVISYDVKNNKFFIMQSNSKNNIYINDTLLLMPVELKDYDVLEIGETKLLFRSLCNENFTWEKRKQEETGKAEA